MTWKKGGRIDSMKLQTEVVVAESARSFSVLSTKTKKNWLKLSAAEKRETENRRHAKKLSARGDGGTRKERKAKRERERDRERDIVKEREREESVRRECLKCNSVSGKEGKKVNVFHLFRSLSLSFSLRLDVSDQTEPDLTTCVPTIFLSKKCVFFRSKVVQDFPESFFLSFVSFFPILCQSLLLGEIWNPTQDSFDKTIRKFVVFEAKRNEQKWKSWSVNDKNNDVLSEIWAVRWDRVNAARSVKDRKDKLIKHITPSHAIAIITSQVNKHLSVQRHWVVKWCVCERKHICLKKRTSCCVTNYCVLLFCKSSVQNCNES